MVSEDSLTVNTETCARLRFARLMLQVQERVDRETVYDVESLCQLISEDPELSQALTSEAFNDPLHPANIQAVHIIAQGLELRGVFTKYDSELGCYYILGDNHVYLLFIEKDHTRIARRNILPTDQLTYWREVEVVTTYYLRCLLGFDSQVLDIDWRENCGLYRQEIDHPGIAQAFIWSRANYIVDHGI